MTVSTFQRPRHRLFGRLVIAIVVVAVAMTAFLMARSGGTGTSVKPSAPAYSVPRIEPGFTGTVNSGPDNPKASISGGAEDNWSCARAVGHTRIC